jgi:hypothetical protein
MILTTTSQTQFLSEIAAGHNGPPIPEAKRAYFQARLRNRLFNFILGKFGEQQKNGLTQAALARRIGKKPDVVNRWLGSPGNLTLDTLSDLLLGISAEEFNAASSKLLNRPPRNYSHWEKLASLSEQSTMTRMNAMSATKAATSQMSIQPTASALDALKNRPQVFDNASASIAIISNQAIQTSSVKMGIQ